MQNDDGGWGAFDRNNDTAILTHLPFADHNAMIDPSTVDVTARFSNVWPLSAAAADPAVAPRLAYLRREQEADGSCMDDGESTISMGRAFVLRSGKSSIWRR